MEDNFHVYLQEKFEHILGHVTEVQQALLRHARSARVRRVGLDPASTGRAKSARAPGSRVSYAPELRSRRLAPEHRLSQRRDLEGFDGSMDGEVCTEILPLAVERLAITGGRGAQELAWRTSPTLPHAHGEATDDDSDVRTGGDTWEDIVRTITSYGGLSDVAEGAEGPSQAKRAGVQDVSTDSDAARNGTRASTCDYSLKWADWCVRLQHESHPLSLRPCWVMSNTSGRSARTSSLMSSLNESNPVRRAWVNHRDKDSLRLSRMRRSEAAIGRMGHASLVVDPSSPGYVIWAIFGMLLLSYDILSLSVAIFEPPEYGHETIIDSISTVYWTLDLCLCFFTAVFVKGEMHKEFKVIVRKYLRTWFVFDVTLVIVQFVSIVHADSGSVAASPALRTLRAARYMKLLRLAKLMQLAKRVLQFSQSVALNTTLRCGAYMCVVIAWVHASACIWYAIGLMEQDSGWVTTVTPNIVGDFPLNYMVCAHWAATQFQGNNDIVPTVSVLERFFAAAQVLISVVVVSLLVSKTTNILQSYELYKQKLGFLEGAAVRYLATHNISNELAVRVRKYIEWKQRQDMDQVCGDGIDEPSLLATLPSHLRRAVLTQSRSPIALQNPVFVALRALSPGLYMQICCEGFLSLAHIPDEHVFNDRAVCKHLYFAVNGESKYLQYSIMMRAMMHKFLDWEADQMLSRCWQRKGFRIAPRTCLSEAVLWVPWVHAGDWRSTTHFSALSLDVELFVHYVKGYRKVQDAFQTHALSMVEALRELEASDLTSSHDLMLMQPCLSSESPDRTTDTSTFTLRTRATATAALSKGRAVLTSSRSRCELRPGA